jgi:hypothetical protein
VCAYVCRVGQISCKGNKTLAVCAVPTWFTRRSGAPRLRKPISDARVEEAAAADAELGRLINQHQSDAPNVAIRCLLRESSASGESEREDGTSEWEGRREGVGA